MSTETKAEEAMTDAATCPRCGHPNLDHHQGFCHHYSTQVSMCGCRKRF
jgi:hypothetical protein